VQKKLSEGMYRTREEFRGDIFKIFDNARIYNQEETIYYKCANHLQSFVKPMLERLKEATNLTPQELEAMRRGRSSDESGDEDEGSSSKKVDAAPTVNQRAKPGRK
jgi:hypothetical protein